MAVKKIKSVEELEKKIYTCSSCLEKKFNGKDGKRHIVVCGGTGCLSSDSQGIIDKLNSLIKEKKLEDKVTVNVVGCFGFCSQGPFVKIFPEDRLYHAVKVSDCERIIDEDIIGGKCIEDLLYEDPNTHQKVEKQEDINFYKKQLRIALHGCGTINPEIIDEALGYDAFKGLIKALSMDRQKVIDSGGLFILGTERHESRRIDNQLRGRSGRQGDVGASKFFLSLEDDLMRIFGSDKLSSMLTKLGLKDDEAIVHPWISKSLEKAQKKVENIHYEMRKNVLKYDDVVNTQRKVIFEQRKDIMFANSIDPEIRYIINDKNKELLDIYIPNKSNVDEWDIDGLDSELTRIYGFDSNYREYVKTTLNVSKEEILKQLNKKVNDIFDDKFKEYGEEVVNTMQKHIYLLTIDRFWKDHLYSLDKLRESIGLRAYGQKDPLLEYKKEAYDMFETLMYNISEEVISILSKVRISIENQEMPRIQANRNIQENRQDFVDAINFMKQQKEGVLKSSHETFTTRSKENFNPKDKATWGRVGRNDPCPCGSGKKYKQCCGKAE